MLTLYPAKKVITMNPSMPEAQAILVEDERIVEVGTIEHMQPWLDAKPHRVDDSFTDHIICPGFIDPHLHPSMAAVLIFCNETISNFRSVYCNIAFTLAIDL